MLGVTSTTALAELSLSPGSSRDLDWTDSVLSSFERLNQSEATPRTRKTIYQPDNSK